MTRTTLDIDDGILQELHRRRRREGKSLGTLVSELLARELSAERAVLAAEPFEWPRRDLGARIDIDDKEALQRLLDR